MGDLAPGLCRGGGGDRDRDRDLTLPLERARDRERLRPRAGDDERRRDRDVTLSRARPTGNREMDRRCLRRAAVSLDRERSRPRLDDGDFDLRLGGDRDAALRSLDRERRRRLVSDRDRDRDRNLGLGLLVVRLESETARPGDVARAQVLDARVDDVVTAAPTTLAPLEPAISSCSSLTCKASRRGGDPSVGMAPTAAVAAVADISTS